jgi:hypothetical protein
MCRQDIRRVHRALALALKLNVVILVYSSNDPKACVKISRGMMAGEAERHYYDTYNHPEFSD